MKNRFENHFKETNLKIAYINYCYDIGKMLECNKRLKELSRKKRLLKIYTKEFMKLNGLTK